MDEDDEVVDGVDERPSRPRMRDDLDMTWAKGGKGEERERRGKLFLKTSDRGGRESGKVRNPSEKKKRETRKKIKTNEPKTS